MFLIIKETFRNNNTINFNYYENFSYYISRNIIQIISENGNIIIDCLKNETSFGFYYDNISSKNKFEFQNSEEKLFF